RSSSPSCSRSTPHSTASSSPTRAPRPTRARSSSPASGATCTRTAPSRSSARTTRSTAARRVRLPPRAPRGTESPSVPSSPASAFEPGDHGNTFGGNPLATAAGVYVMKQLLEGGVLENVRARSDQLRQRLEGLVDRHDIVRGVRGRGLLMGLELHREIAADVV